MMNHSEWIIVEHHGQLRNLSPTGSAAETGRSSIPKFRQRGNLSPTGSEAETGRSSIPKFRQFSKSVGRARGYERTI